MKNHFCLLSAKEISLSIGVREPRIWNVPLSGSWGKSPMQLTCDPWGEILHAGGILPLK
jgi:hypothetical protein